MIWTILISVVVISIISYAGYRIWYLAGKLADAQEYMKRLKDTYVTQRIKGNLEMLVWKDYIHSIFNLKEFIYLN